jgi:hypothetical protein
MLARAGSIGDANAYPAEISLPQDMDRDKLRLGMPETATVFADNARRGAHRLHRPGTWSLLRWR